MWPLPPHHSLRCLVLLRLQVEWFPTIGFLFLSPIPASHFVLLSHMYSLMSLFKRMLVFVLSVFFAPFICFCLLSTHLSVSFAWARCRPDTHSPFYYGFQCSRPWHYFQGSVCVCLCVVVYVCAPNVASRAQCAYVYMFTLDTASRAQCVYSVCVYVCL